MTVTTTEQTQGWGRRRLLLVLGGAAACVLTLVGGLAYAVVSSLTGNPATASVRHASPATTTGPAWRDQVAAAPMLRVGPAAARGGTLAATPGPTIQVPTATREGPAAVPTGYPRTPSGAIGQLAAIDTTVIAGMSVEHSTTIHTQWALPGAPPASAWVMTGNVRAFLAAATTTDAVVAATPVAAQIKGTDGLTWVLACVLLRVDAAAASSASVAYGHCEPMQWHDQRWQIAPGTRAAPAPSTWPGTDLFRAAGWRTWVPEQGQD